MADIINAPMRRGIKIMADVAHVANCISQMPKPNDFALMITSDMIYMSGKVQELVTNIRTLMDAYSDIPFDFLETHFNSIMNSTTDIIGRVNTFTNDNISSAMNFAQNTVDLQKELIDTAIDMYGTVSETVVSMSANVGIIGESFKDRDKANELKSQLDEAISDIKNKTDNTKNKATGGLQKASNAIANAKDDAMGFVNDKLGNATNNIISFQNSVMELIKKIKDSIDNFSKSVDDLFGLKSEALDLTDSLSSLGTSGNESAVEKMMQTAVEESSKIIGGLIENFSIGKFLSGCAGMTANIALVQTGLNKLPPIDVNKILSCINGIERNIIKSSVSIDDLVQYSPDEYNKYKEQFEEELKKQRNSIRSKIANKNKKSSLATSLRAEEKAISQARKNLMNGISSEEKSNIKSAIKEIRKQRRKARKGKKANKLKDTILLELRKFYREVKELLNSVKKKWYSMIDNYRQSVKEIKDFFLNGGTGDIIIEKICTDINQNCNDIKQLCTVDLPLQIVNVNINVTMPRCIGLAAPNFVQHIIQYFSDLKVIIKFIMDLLRYVMNIIRDINELVNIVRNGTNNLTEIFSEIMSILGLGWLLNLVTKIQDKFNSSVSSTLSQIENTLEPVYFKDTEQYETMMDNFDSLVEHEIPEGSSLSQLSNSLSSVISSDTAIKIYNDNLSEDKLDEIADKLDEIGDTIVAYRSPVFKRDEYGNIITETGNATTYIQDIDDNTIPNLAAYIYYHPNLYHFDESSFGKKLLLLNIGKIRRRRKSRYIKKASKRSNKRNGGVTMLKNRKKLFYDRNANKSVSAFDAFYWYTVITNSFDIDYATDGENIDKLSKVVFNTSSGSVVRITLENNQTQEVFVKDANVKSGDYVNYNGKRYKIL